MSKPNLPIDEIHELLRRHFPDATPPQQLSEGEESRAFRSTANRKKLVIRINRDTAGFEKDRFAFQHFSRARLPIPVVFAIGRTNTGFGYCISQRLRGTTLQDTPPVALARLRLPTSLVLKMVAASDISAISGFGPFDGSGVAGFPSWHAFLRHRIEQFTAALELDTSRIRRSIARGAIGGAEWFQNWCPEARQLIHGDFGSNNVLAHRKRITGVLDWESAMIGDSLYDLANIGFWSTELSCMAAQWEFIRAYPVHHGYDGQRLTCYQLHIGLEEYAAACHKGDAATQEWAVNKLRFLLDKQGILYKIDGTD